MKIGYLIIICSTIATLAFAADLNKNAHSVIINSDVKVTYISPKKCITEYYDKILILDKEGNSNADFNYKGSKFSTITAFTAKVSDMFGKTITKYSKSSLEVSKLSEHLMSDEVSYHLSMSIYTYPYYVDISYKTECDKGFLHFDSGWPYLDFGTSIEHYSYSLSVPDTLNLNIKSNGFPEPITKTAKGTKTLTWTLDSLPAIKNEALLPNIKSIVPHISIRPKYFYYDGHYGQINNWNDYAVFQKTLYDGRDILPAKTAEEIKKLTDTIPDFYGKVNAIYKFLGASTHYESIQYGIGGWQPIDADKVGSVGYGDCKALSNYMKALLSIINIRSYPAIVNSSIYHEMFDYDNVTLSEFNHVILAIPDPTGKDTIWAECTNTKLPLGYIHSNIGGKTALVLKENAPYTVKIPNCKPSECNTNIEVWLKEDGNAEINYIEYLSNRDYETHRWLLKENRNEIEKYLRKQFKLPSVTVKSYSVEQPSDNEAFIKISAQLTTEKFCNIKSGRMFIPVNITSTISNGIPHKERFNPIEINKSFIANDTLKIHLPSYLKVEKAPSKTETSSSFGNFTSSADINDSTCNITHSFSLNDGVYEKTKAKELSEFLSSIYKIYSEQFVIILK